MDIVTLILIMLLLVVVSAFLDRMLPAVIPLPLVQVGLGALVALITHFDVKLKPDIFFILFLPPLLFYAAWQIPKAGLLRNRGLILELALGLVLFTVVGMGYMIHWIIPAMPLAVAFALAAVLAPTDPVAVASVAKRVPVPRRILHILEGESLLNDASGLVCLQFAVAAALTRQFSLPHAAFSFLWLATGGLATGVLLTGVVVWLKNKGTALLGEDGGAQVLISLLIPFGAYIAAERLHCSGILAVVGAGVTMGRLETAGMAAASTRVRRNVTWSTVDLVLNGVIFILLGEQLPAILRNAANVVYDAGHDKIWRLGMDAAAITIALALLRLIWVWVTVRFMGQSLGIRSHRLSSNVVLALSASGVRGTVTLAGILTLPLTMPDGAPFPGRDLAIFLAASVIIISLVAASLILPPILKRLNLPEDASGMGEKDARLAAAQAAIEAVGKAYLEINADDPDADIYKEAALRITDIYQQQIEASGDANDEQERVRRTIDIDRRFRLVALKAAREKLFDMTRSRELDGDIMRKMVREIDLIETRYRIHTS